MKYLIGFILGLAAGILLNIFWKRKFGKYLPLEDAFVLKFAFAAGYYIAGIISGLLISSINKYAAVAGIVLLLVYFLISFCFGTYYKVVETKNINV